MYQRQFPSPIIIARFSTRDEFGVEESAVQLEVILDAVAENYGTPRALVGQRQADSQGPFAPWAPTVTRGFHLTASGC